MDRPHWPYTLGGTTNILHPPYFDRPYFVGELVAIWLSVAFNLLVYAWAMAGLLRGGSQNWLVRLYPNVSGDVLEQPGPIDSDKYVGSGPR